MKRQHHAVLAKKTLKINMLMIKNILKLTTIIILLINTALLHIAYMI